MMTTRMDHYRFTARQIAGHKCVGCGVNVIKAGDYCMLNSDLWERRLRLKPTDNVCIACIEARIGWRLNLFDFVNFPSIQGFPTSSILLSRLGFEQPKRKRGDHRDAQTETHSDRLIEHASP